MKQFLILIIFTFFQQSYSQKTVDATIILKSKDTITAKVLVKTNLFNKKLINELSFSKYLVILKNNDKQKIKEENIDFLEFVDFNGKLRIFISGMKIPFLKLHKLYEQKVKGKMSFYRGYSRHGYDGSVQIIDYYILGYNEPEVITIFNGKKNKRKKLKKMIGNNNYYDAIIDTLRTNQDIIKFMKMYNENEQ